MERMKEKSMQEIEGGISLECGVWLFSMGIAGGICVAAAGGFGLGIFLYTVNQSRNNNPCYG